MSAKIKSNRAKLIYERIDRERERIFDSKTAIEDSICTVKGKINEVAQSPLSFLTSGSISVKSVTPRAVMNHPLVTTLSVLAIGWGIGYILRNNKRQIGRAIVRPMEKLAEGTLNSNFAQAIVSEVNTTAKSIVGELFSRAREVVEEYLFSITSRNGSSRNSIIGESPRWDERPAGYSNKTYYTH